MTRSQAEARHERADTKAMLSFREVSVRSMCLLVATGTLAAALAVTGEAQSPRPLPDREALFRATQENLARAQREQGRYSYRERRTELHTNPFGRLGTDGVVVYSVTPGPEPDVVYRTLLEKDGVKVANAKPERQERRERRQFRSSIDDVVDTLNFSVDRREVRDGRDTIVVTFAAKPDARPQTREGRLAKLFTGSIYVDEAASEVSRVEGVAIDSISFGFGMIARLNEGTRVSLVREPVEGGIWLPTSIRFTGEGRAILFRKLNVDLKIDWYDYKRVR